MKHSETFEMLQEVVICSGQIAKQKRVWRKELRGCQRVLETISRQFGFIHLCISREETDQIYQVELVPITLMFYKKFYSGQLHAFASIPEID